MKPARGSCAVVKPGDEVSLPTGHNGRVVFVRSKGNLPVMAIALASGQTEIWAQAKDGLIERRMVLRQARPADAQDLAEAVLTDTLGPSSVARTMNYLAAAVLQLLQERVTQEARAKARALEIISLGATLPVKADVHGDGLVQCRFGQPLLIVDPHGSIDEASRAGLADGVAAAINAYCGQSNQEVML